MVGSHGRGRGVWKEKLVFIGGVCIPRGGSRDSPSSLFRLSNTLWSRSVSDSNVTASFFSFPKNSSVGSIPQIPQKKDPFNKPDEVSFQRENSHFPRNSGNSSSAVYFPSKPWSTASPLVVGSRQCTPAYNTSKRRTVGGKFLKRYKL